MLLKTVMFDENNPNWINDEYYNLVFLRYVEQHLNDCIRHRGYVYLNQICEHLGVRWNPEDENPCIRNDGIDRIAFIQFERFPKPNNSSLIQIHCYD